MLRSYLCCYSDVYIVKGRVNVTGTDSANRQKKT